MPFAWQHTHRLIINGNQSFFDSSARVFSTVCVDCHFHFVFKMEWQEAHEGGLCDPRQSRWPVKDAQFPWHHMVWGGSDTDSNIVQENSKHYPLLAREYFMCCAPPCTFQVTLEISNPRMGSWWIDLLQDQEAIKETLRKAKEEDPERYEAATEDWATQATLNLNTYLKNLIDVKSPDDVRSISKRNKRFAVLFGPRCFEIFRQLEWDEKIDEQNGRDEGSFTPKFPSPPGGPDGTTELGTYRAFLEDVRAEVQALIHRSGAHAEFCTPALHKELRCVEVPNIDQNALVDIHRYKLVGVLPNQPKEIVVSAYKRQWDLLPSKRRELIEALLAIANDLNDEQLSDYAMTQSSVFESQLQNQNTNDDDGLVTQALIFLGLQPPNNYSAEALMQAFRRKLAQDPGDATSARSMLLVIAKASTDDTYQTALQMEAEGRMSFATSKEILGLNDANGFGPDALDAAKAKVSK